MKPANVFVYVPAGEVALEGELTVPEGAFGVVLFAHGNGSSRFSPRNRQVAQVLQSGGLATLLMDLLSRSEEEIDRDSPFLRFDVALLGERLIAASNWLRRRSDTRGLSIGYFGASTGAGAALFAAARCPELVSAVVSRGGRPDLAGGALTQVRAPTLLIVGGNDVPVIGLNRAAMARMPAPAKLEIIPGATHLFEEPGALEQVAGLACAWFEQHLGLRREAPAA